MLRIAVQSKGRLFDDTMNLLSEADIKVSASKRTLLVQSSNFPLEVLYLRDDDIPQSVAGGVADIGIVGLNEYMERHEDAQIIEHLGFSKCRLSLAIPKDINYTGLDWFNGKKIATSYPGILRRFLHKNNIQADIHVITGTVLALCSASSSISPTGTPMWYSHSIQISLPVHSRMGFFTKSPGLSENRP